MFNKLFASQKHLKAFPIKDSKSWLLPVVLLFFLASLAGCGSNSRLSGKSYVINGKRYHILATAAGYREKGLASWYGEPFHGRKTASGEVYDMHDMSAAHKTLPLHTWVEVKNLKTNQKMILRINDRGPFIDGRIIDLSRAAARELGVYRPGTAPVLVTALSPAQAKRFSEKLYRDKKRASND